MSDEPQQPSVVTEPASVPESPSAPVVDPATLAQPDPVAAAPIPGEVLPAIETPTVEANTPVQVEQAPIETPPISPPTVTETVAQSATVQPQAASNAVPIIALRPQAQAARTNRIQKKVDKIMEFVRERKTIRNDDIEKLLHVSDSTVQRYLGTLVKQGKLRNLGNRGSTHYELT